MGNAKGNYQKIIEYSSQTTKSQGYDKSNNHWMTPETLAVMEERKELKKKGLATEEDKNTYKELLRRI